MTRFFLEDSSDTHTNLSTAEIVNPPSRSETAHKAICSDFKKFFLGFLVVDDSGFNGFGTSPNADIKMFFMPYFNPIFIETLKQILEPMWVSHLETSRGINLFFDTRKLPEDHLLWTYQGRMAIFHELMHNLIQATIENIKTHALETDDIGDEAQNSQTFLARLSQEMPHFTEEKILGLLNDYFNVFQKDFDSSSKFERKYQI